MILFKYIFYKVYFFYVKAFGEKEIPHWFASSVITLIVVANLIIIADIILYISNPEIIKTISTYYKYFALAVLAGVMIFINSKNRYLKIIEDCEHLPERSKKIMNYVSILYVTVVFVGFFYIGEIIRNYNLMQ